jgi:hypothetical protein
MDGDGPIGQPPVFRIGLALAGAISAGAYTAGVLDFLFQALSEWEDRRGQPGVPDHRVLLEVIAGASAGAIAGALGAIALARGIRPDRFSRDQIADRYPDTYSSRQEFMCVLPPLYRTWVELPRMVEADGVGGLLGNSDLQSAAGEAPPIVRSLLDASLLDKIKRAAIEPDQDQAPIYSYPFVAGDLHIYVTISNMRGIPFRVAFGPESYGMQTIGDRVHYVIGDLGQTKSRNQNCWLDKDTKNASHSISTNTLPKRKGDDLGDWGRYGTTALASGAFPVGLSCRRLEFSWKHYTERQYPIPLPDGVQIAPDFPPDIAQQYRWFSFESIDGGLVNNDPFDYAQYALMGGPAEPASGESVGNAIIMVAPFPEPPEFLPENSPSPAIAAIVRALFPALINQARFRTADLAPALNEHDFSRYIIAPLRRIPRSSQNTAKPERQRFAIACGLLSGFGGFLDEQFRAHDFQLGRRNCQHFLQKTFRVPANNKIVGRSGATETVPVIPLYGSAVDPVPLPRWPRMSQADLTLLASRIKARVDAIIPRLLDAQTSSARLRMALKFGWAIFLRSRVLSFVQQIILADLVRRGQIEGWDVPDGLPDQGGGGSINDVNAVIAELINPAYDYRTPDAIARKTRLPIAFVEATLKALSASSANGPMRVWRDDFGFTLYSRRPGFLARLAVVCWFNRWWNAPTVN